MRKVYAGFGLQLHSGFALPGMVSRPADGLPAVVLELETPAQLEAQWSGPAFPNPWRGRLGDGEIFAVEWGEEGDLLFSYGKRARFHLDRDAARLGCVPADATSADWQRVLITRVLPNVSLARGREALHASAVATPAGVVAVAAPSGMGKSTLAAELMRRGWPLFADDTVILERSAGAVIAHPASPHTNLPATEADGEFEPPGSTLAVLAGERWLAVESASERPGKLAALVLLERGPGARLEATPLQASPLAIAPYMLGLPEEQADRAAARFALYSDLVDAAELLRLTADPAARPPDLADTLESALDLGSRAVAGGAA